ncbi:substrate-binding domain-containing protein [Streptomyces sp. B6B3]|uniref:substrate-binding domain-containing protein n=1 Tax=Streptomyces sp. B6B3 TaxID=3153570 RepID=UPI00325F5795
MADMLVSQRQDLLLRELRASGAVRVRELAAQFGVSPGTIRRDLHELAAAGALVRVRGGALAPGSAANGAAESAPPTAPTPTQPLLGLLVPSAAQYFAPVIAGVRATAARRGARVVIGISDPARPRDLAQIRELSASGAAGLLVASAGGGRVPGPLLDGLRAAGVPFVLLERRPEDAYEPCDFVVSDHRQGAFAAVRHLHRLGHDRVALYCGDGPVARLVREGHADAVRLLGLDPSAPVRAGARDEGDERDEGAGGDASTAAPRRYDEFVERCLAGGARAALVHSDRDAIVLLQRLRAQGLRVPEDLALIAYDDEMAALAEVPLTAVAPPKRQIGGCATGLLLDQLDGRRPSTHNVVMQPRLVVRQSCGHAAAEQVRPSSSK